MIYMRVADDRESRINLSPPLPANRPSSTTRDTISFTHRSISGRRIDDLAEGIPIHSVFVRKGYKNSSHLPSSRHDDHESFIADLVRESQTFWGFIFDRIKAGIFNFRSKGLNTRYGIKEKGRVELTLPFECPLKYDIFPQSHLSSKIIACF